MAPQTENDAGTGPNSAGNNSTNQGADKPPRGKRTKPSKKSPKKRNRTENKKHAAQVLHVPKVTIPAFVTKPITEENSIKQFNDWLETATG